MAWDAGTITDAADPVGALWDKVEALMGLDATGGREPTRNWSVVETIPTGTGAGQFGSASFYGKVYKCAGSGTDANDSGTDVFMVTRENNTPLTSGFEAAVCESYDPTAGQKKVKRQVGRYNVTSIVPDATTFTYNDTYITPQLAQSTGSAKTTGGGSWTSTSMFNTTGFSYWIKLNHNFLMVATRVSVTNYNVGMGVTDSTMGPTAAAAYGPGLIIWGGTTSTTTIQGQRTSSADVLFARLPAVTVPTTGSNNDVWTGTLQFWTRGPIGNTNATDKFLDGEYPASRIAIQHTGGSAAADGKMFGLLKPEILATSSSIVSGLYLGDTFDIDGNTWVVVSLPGVINSAMLVRPI